MGKYNRVIYCEAVPSDASTSFYLLYRARKGTYTRVYPRQPGAAHDLSFPGHFTDPTGFEFSSELDARVSIGSEFMLQAREEYLAAKERFDELARRYANT